jgi:hypothetical protein
MRNLKTFVVGITSALASAAFAQAPHASSNEGIVVQAQAGGQMGSPMGGPTSGQTGQQSGPSGSGASADRMKDQEKTGDPMVSDKHKDQGGYHSPSSSTKANPSRDTSSQAQRSKKQQPKDFGG